MTARQLTWMRWRAIDRPPRSLWIPCVGCACSTLNEDKHLAGWQQTTRAPRFYRCPDCSTAAETPPTGDAV